MRCFDLHSKGQCWTRMFPVQNYFPFASFKNPGQLYGSSTLKTQVQFPARTDQFMLLCDSCRSCIELLLVDLLCVKSCYSFCLKKNLSLPPNIYIYRRLSAVSLSFPFFWDKKAPTSWKPNQQGQRTISQGDLEATRWLPKTVVYLEVNLCN